MNRLLLALGFLCLMSAAVLGGEIPSVPGPPPPPPQGIASASDTALASEVTTNEVAGEVTNALLSVLGFVIS